jgi:phosphoglycolate phosphatase-like HAD superfamily hydrolase
MNLNFFKLIFWDFDGVIKESVSVKTEAFQELFKPYGNTVCKKIKFHHLENSGMSRFEKIPLYLEWANIRPTNTKVKEMCKKFGKIVKNKVINSKWVPGVETFLDNFKDRYIFIIVSATPQGELNNICRSLNIDKYFYKIFGSPISKSEAIKISLSYYKVLPDKCLMIGDALADMNAAKENKIKFIFRKHKENQSLNIYRDTHIIKDFYNIENFFKTK